jgi:hypothetical protein
MTPVKHEILIPVAPALMCGSSARVRETTIAYLEQMHCSQEQLLRGVNGIAALTFCEVPIATPSRGK